MSASSSSYDQLSEDELLLIGNSVAYETSRLESGFDSSPHKEVLKHVLIALKNKGRDRKHLGVGLDAAARHLTPWWL
ncbi:hypothetical protein GAY28_24850 [Azospirillum brasilense]|nr:hypothetical protein [Azospirillum brasilense]